MTAMKSRTTAEKIEAVLTFLPLFGQGGKSLYGFNSDSPTDPCSYSPEVDRFVRALYDHDFIIQFDWTTWKEEAQRFVEHPELVEQADFETLQKLLTTHVRQERFCNGHLASVIDNGHLLAVMRRLNVIRSNLDSPTSRSPHAPVSSQTHQLRQLLVQSWAAYDQLHDQNFVVRPSIPILFFGDSKRYFASTLRVITVGKNPSGEEFPQHERFARFPIASSIATDSDGRDYSLHIESLNAYFQTKPYRRWFSSFEPILNGLDSSYYGDQMSTALHTDLCSPLATAPTWSELLKDQQMLLSPDGIRIWHSLIETLAPDIILISIPQDYLSQIRFPVLAPDRVIWTLKQKRLYEVRVRVLGIETAKPSFLVFGGPRIRRLGP